MGFLQAGRRKSEGRFFLAAEELLPFLLELLCFHLLYLAIGACVAVGRGEGQHDDVLPVLPLFLLVDGQYDIHLLPSLHVGAGIAQVAHGLFGLDPWPSAHGPSGTSLQAEVQAQALCLLSRMANQLLPLRAEAFHMLFRAWPVGRVSHLSVKELHAFDARLGNGLQVACDAFAADAAVQEMEPRLGIKDAMGLTERQAVGLREGTAEHGRVGHHATACRSNVPVRLCMDVSRAKAQKKRQEHTADEHESDGCLHRKKCYSSCKVTDKRAENKKKTGFILFLPSESNFERQLKVTDKRAENKKKTGFILFLPSESNFERQLKVTDKRAENKSSATRQFPIRHSLLYNRVR